MAKLPSTPALRLLRSRGVSFDVLTYPYVPRGGVRASSTALDVDPHLIVKTLVFEDAASRPLIILMHGDREVSTKALARELKTKRVRPCDPSTAQRHTGYKVGGTSPFGTKSALPVYVESTVLALPDIVINGGARGVLVRIRPSVLHDLLAPIAVTVAQ